MPIYEFQCQQCHAEFEARVARVGGRPNACPSCGAAELEKRLSSFAAHTASGAPTDAPTPCSMGAQCGRLTGHCGSN